MYYGSPRKCLTVSNGVKRVAELEIGMHAPRGKWKGALVTLARAMSLEQWGRSRDACEPRHSFQSVFHG